MHIGGEYYLSLILYLSVAVIAAAFLILVIYLSRTLNSMGKTLDSVSKTLENLEKQLDGVTSETTMLLHTTNDLASDIQQKTESLNSVVDAVKGVGDSVRKFNASLRSITNEVELKTEENKDKIAQVVQWSNIMLELKDKWQTKKEKKQAVDSLEQGYRRQKARARH